MNLFNYINAKRIKIIDVDNGIWIGIVHDVIPEEDNDDGRDSIVIRSELKEKFNGKLVEFTESEIRSIEILD